MLTDAELNRIDDTRWTTEKSNCIGTVLYICGTIAKDTYVDFREKGLSKGLVDEYLETLVKSNTLEIGSVLVVRDTLRLYNHKHVIRHMGIIIDDDPFIVYHRIGYGYKPSIQVFSEFMRTYQYEFNVVEHYNKTK